MRDGKKMMSRPGQKAGLSTYSSLSQLEIGTGLASREAR
jgi:hypothetical protein